MIDAYWTIAAPSEGQYTQLRSKFIAYALPVESEEEALGEVARLRKEYYDARHVCWAYRLGIDGATTRSNDDGEPSGTAGKPILGQILSQDLTQVVVVVVRYFGGVKLGTPGLIESYRAAAYEALTNATRLERTIERAFSITFGYELMGEVMRLVKDAGANILSQEFVERCALEVSLRIDQAHILYERLEKLYGTSLRWSDEDAD